MEPDQVFASPEWAALTKRRRALTRRKSLHGLSPAEADEYELLNAAARRMLMLAYPGIYGDDE